MQRRIRKRFDDDRLVLKCRVLARQRIKKAIRLDGSLDWGRLPKLVTVNPKLLKQDDADPYLSAGFQGAPSWASGYNTCSGASLGCSAECLFGAGHGQRHMLQNGEQKVWIARITRTILFYEYREQFKIQMVKEIQAFKRKAQRKGFKSAFRPNVITDIDWVKLMPVIFDQGIDVLYDYTKVAKRLRAVMRPAPYHLTLSRHEDTPDELIDSTVGEGFGNVAVVFSTKKGKALPCMYRGFPVIDGDLTDNRFNDPIGVIVGLRVKNTGKKDESGFVVNHAAWS